MTLLRLEMLMVVGLVAACGGDDGGDDGGDGGMSSSGQADGSSSPSTTAGTGGASTAASDDEGQESTIQPPEGSTTAGDVTGQGAEGESSPCFDGDSCLSVLEILLPDDRDTFTIYLDIDPDTGTASCPDGTATDWLTDERVTLECGTGSLTISVSMFKFDETVSVGLDDGEPQAYTPGFEDEQDGCTSQCNQATLQL